MDITASEGEGLSAPWRRHKLRVQGVCPDSRELSPYCRASTRTLSENLKPLLNLASSRFFVWYQRHCCCVSCAG